MQYVNSGTYFSSNLKAKGPITTLFQGTEEARFRLISKKTEALRDPGLWSSVTAKDN